MNNISPSGNPVSGALPQADGSVAASTAPQPHPLRMP